MVSTLKLSERKHSPRYKYDMSSVMVLLLLWWATGATRANRNIAVCISGQASRWLPSYVVDGLLRPNMDHNFALFFNIQTGTTMPIHSSGVGFDPSEMVFMNHSATNDYLRQLLGNLNNVQLASLQFYQAQSLEHWVDVLQGPLSFTQYNMQHGSLIGVNIMNMYSAHVQCAQQIEAYEKAHQAQLQQDNVQTPDSLWRFDYIISTREDAYLYAPVALAPLLDLLRTDLNNPVSEEGNHGKCDIVYRDCLSHAGINMRMQLMNRDAGLLMLRRFHAYKETRDRGWITENPEQFEYIQAFMFGLTPCAVPVTQLPIGVARHVANGAICFYDFEAKDCYPPSAAAEVAAVLRCEDVERLLADNITFVLRSVN